MLYSLRLLETLFGIRRGEGSIVFPALAIGFLAVAASVLASIAGDTLFVSTFDMRQVSAFYAVSALARVALAFGWAALPDRAAGPTLDAIVLIGNGVLMVTCGLAASGSPPMVYASCLGLALFPPLLPIVAFGAVMGCFQTRQAKRLLPLVAAAASVGSIAGGILASLLAARLGTASLLHAGAALALAAAPLPRILARHASTDEPAAAPTREPSLVASLVATASTIGRVPVIRATVAHAFFVALIAALVDFGFKSALKQRYARDEMASYIASFGVISHGAVLITQLLLTSRLISRFGVSAAMRSLPAAAVIFGPALIVVPGVAGATGLRMVTTWLRHAIGGSVGDVLLTSVPASLRNRAKVAAKNIAAPLGALVAGGALVVFGTSGPPPMALAAMVVGAGAVGFLVLGDVRQAYAAMLARTLGEGRVTLDVSPASAAVLRGQIVRQLARSVEEGDEPRARDTLALMSDRLFALPDLGPALSAEHPGIRGEARRLAVRMARPGEGELLLSQCADDPDDGVEALLLSAARRLGHRPDRARIDRALARAGTREESADLWAEAALCLSETEKDAALKQLRKAARAADGPRRAAAFRAIGELGDRRAETEVLMGLGSPDVVVFAAAARAAVALEAQGGVPTLIAQLIEGPHVRAAGRALAGAGASAVEALIAALPTTRGEAGPATAIASHGRVSGTVRAARVLARLGPDACARLLDRYDDLGYRARDAVARALAIVPKSTGTSLDPARITRAMETNLAYGETLLAQSAAISSGLFGFEVRHRVKETGERLLDLAAATFDRPMIERARAALAREDRDRDKALELLENVLPPALAARVVALLEGASRGSILPPRRTELDGWLSRCRALDEGTLPSRDPMSQVMSKILVLREASLFTALSGEELYPVGEIAEPISLSAGEAVVSQGDPGDALYVVESGTFEVVRDGKPLRAIERGAVFGEMALLDGSPRAASVVALTDGSVLRIPRREFEALLDESPEIARGVIKTLLGHLRHG